MCCILLLEDQEVEELEEVCSSCDQISFLLYSQLSHPFGTKILVTFQLHLDLRKMKDPLHLLHFLYHRKARTSDRSEGSVVTCHLVSTVRMDGEAFHRMGTLNVEVVVEDSHPDVVGVGNCRDDVVA